MRALLPAILVLSFNITLPAQEVVKDSLLGAITVQAYTADRPPELVPASIGLIGPQTFERFNPTSLIPAVNTVAGVRMEERSPGSYRFSIRGSTLRSPFGIGNVKVYWNGMPLTDGGGNTYLDLVDVSQVQNMEIIKGPGGSLYGAGTGGVILMTTPRIRQNGFSISSMVGSYGMARLNGKVALQSKKIAAGASFSIQASDGYRKQSEMSRKVFDTNLSFFPSDDVAVHLTFFYSDLYYETPGGLTRAQFEADPSQARPSFDTPAGHFAGAEEQKAAVNNESAYLGLMLDKEWNDQWNTTLGVNVSKTDFVNPTIRNFEERHEPNLGIRTVTKRDAGRGDWKTITSIGAELQMIEATIDVNENDQGNKTAVVLSADELNYNQFSLFAQYDILFKEVWNITAGLSANFAAVKFNRLTTDVSESRNFDPVLSPRIAVLHKLNNAVSAYGSFSRGFSPPTIAELFPSREVFDKDLKPENGNNFEVGVKGKIRSLKYDLTGYHLGLNNTIVIRRDASLPGEPEYFANAGKTAQRGFEATLNWTIIENQTEAVNMVRLLGSYSYNHYRFVDFVQSSTELSGNKLTGVPPTMFFAGFDLATRPGIYLNVSSNYVDHIPLNDANTVFSDPYLLLGARMGFRKELSKGKSWIEFFGGVENATDERYSAGHDLNAVGNRFYNAAPRRSFFIGAKFDLD